MQQCNHAGSIIRRLRSGLGRHLILVLVLKVVLLTALWYAFIKPYRVTVDHNVMSARIVGPASPVNRENSHDRSNGR